MNKIQSLCPGVQEVANEFERRLTVLNLPIKTIRSYFITVRKLSSFMIEKEVEQYSPEIGSDFLIYLAKKEGFSQNYINCHANVIRRLNERLSDSFWVNPYVFSSYVIKHDDIKESYDQIIHDLERLGLKQTIGYTKRCLVALDIYMAEYHIDKYETSVGTDYLSCMKEVTGMALKAFSFRYIEVINRLNSVFEGKMPDYYVPKSYRFCCLELENAMNDTIERLRTFGYTERVLCQVRTTISNLDMYMNQRGISTYDKQVGSAFLDYYETRYVEDKNINRDIAAISALSHFNDTFFGEEARRLANLLPIACQPER